MALSQDAKGGNKNFDMDLYGDEEEPDWPEGMTDEMKRRYIEEQEK